MSYFICICYCTWKEKKTINLHPTFCSNCESLSNWAFWGSGMRDRKAHHPNVIPSWKSPCGLYRVDWIRLNTSLEGLWPVPKNYLEYRIIWCSSSLGPDRTKYKFYCCPLLSALPWARYSVSQSRFSPSRGFLKGTLESRWDYPV